MTKHEHELIEEFINVFEDVFDRDWGHTKEMLGIHEETPEQKRNTEEMGLEAIPLIAAHGTFLNPKVDDEAEDWGNRAKLLQLYRKLKKEI